jgi:hypothetical protein
LEKRRIRWKWPLLTNERINLFLRAWLPTAPRKHPDFSFWPEQSYFCAASLSLENDFAVENGQIYFRVLDFDGVDRENIL